MKVALYNPKTNRSISIKWGVSWTYLIFGGLALLFQRRWIYMLVEICLIAMFKLTEHRLFSVILFLYHVTLFLFGNKIYARYLLDKGWKPANEVSKSVLSR